MRKCSCCHSTSDDMLLVASRCVDIHNDESITIETMCLKCARISWSDIAASITIEEDDNIIESFLRLLK